MLSFVIGAVSCEISFSHIAYPGIRISFLQHLQDKPVALTIEDDSVLHRTTLHCHSAAVDTSVVVAASQVGGRTNSYVANMIILSCQIGWRI